MGFAGKRPHQSMRASFDARSNKRNGKRTMKNVKEDPYSQRARRRHSWIYRLIRPLAKLVLRLKFNFAAEQFPEIPGNYIALANHNTNWDMIMMGVASPRPMYFVASEHIFYKGWLSRLLLWAVAPIARVKGAVAASTVLYTTRALRRGDNICLFCGGEPVIWRDDLRDPALYRQAGEGQRRRAGHL